MQLGPPSTLPCLFVPQGLRQQLGHLRTGAGQLQGTVTRLQALLRERDALSAQLQQGNQRLTRRAQVGSWRCAGYERPSGR